MFFYALPDSHIEFLSEHADTFRSYMEGKEPEIRRSLLDKILGREIDLDPPDNWPQNELEGYCPEVNHRQVEYFHYLLNGTKDKVDHAGCIFQTWFAPRTKSIAITIDGENFALKSESVLSLKELIQKISEEELLLRHRQVTGDEITEDSDREFLTGAFEEIVHACDEALGKRAGLMWTAG